MKLFGNKKREPGYAGDPNHKGGAGGTDDRGLPKTKPEPAVSEESKQTAGAIKGSGKSSGGLLSKLFGSKKTDDALAEPMSNVEYLGEIYKLLKQNQEDIKFERQESVEKKRTDDNDEENRHKEIIKALTLRRQPKKTTRRAKKEEKPEPDKDKGKSDKGKSDKGKSDKDKADKDKAASDKAAKDKAAADKAKADKDKADKAAADKAKADKDKADKAAADKAKADKDAADKAKADKAAADKAKADKQKELQEKTKREQLDKEKDAAKKAKDEADRKAKEAKTQAEKESVKREQEAAQKKLEEVEKAKQKAAEQAAERAKQKAADEAQKKAAEEAKRKAAEEAKRKAAEEAKRKAAEEEKKRVAEEAKRKAAEEEKKRLAEEERKRLAEEKTRTAEKVPETKPASQPTAQTQPKPAPKPDTATPKPAPKPDVGTATQVITGTGAIVISASALATMGHEQGVKSGADALSVSNKDDYRGLRKELSLPAGVPKVGAATSDTFNSTAYGLFGLSNKRYDKNGNKGTSTIDKFVGMYGKSLGLPTPGDEKDKKSTDAFNKAWWEAAKRDPNGMLKAQVDFYKKDFEEPSMKPLEKHGISADIINDAGVKMFMTDRAIQYGVGAFSNAVKSAKGAKTPAEFIKMVAKYDMEHLQDYFASSIENDKKYWKNNQKGLEDRVTGRVDNSLKMVGSTTGGTLLNASTTNNSLKGDLNKSKNKNSNDSTTFFTDPFGAPEYAPPVNDGPIHTRGNK